MPRKAKDKTEIIEEKNAKKSTTKLLKKEITSKSNLNKEVSKNSKKTENKVSNKSKTSTKKAATKSSTKKSTKVTSKKSTNAIKAKSSSKKIADKSTTKTTATKKSTKKEKVEIIEYYDLPYRYNQTVVKVLAQTPNTLFVYWDISDDDKNKYIEVYGEYFFNNTKPVLIVHNLTMNYSFEIDINDFANSWYLNVADSNCDYKIELGRRPINEYVTINNNYLYIANSNDIDAPNDHILFDNLSKFVYFRNVKTNTTTKKDIISFSLLRKIGKISSIEEFYKKMYANEKISFDKLDLRNPSSKF
mgnify:CR=1 FL=1